MKRNDGWRGARWRRIALLGAALSLPWSASAGDKVDLRREPVQLQQDERETFLKEARQRKDAYERYGIEPRVPRSLSADPNDPEFAFVGYARVGSTEEALEAQVHALDARDAEDEDRTAARDLGVFVNAVGEMWRWTPKDREKTIAAARAAQGLDRRARELPGFEGHGPVDPAGDEGAGDPTREIIGSTDSRTIRSKDAGHNMKGFPWRAIGALTFDGQDWDSPNARCTATKIGPRHLLTAGHCVHSGGSGGSLLLRDWWSGQDGMDFYANGGDPNPNGIRSIQWYWIHSKWIDDAKYNRDYAVLILYDSSSTVGLGWFGLKVDYTLANTSAWNFGYPAWGNTCDNSTWANNSCRNSLWGMSAKITRTTSRMAYYKHDTQGGHSGSPIYQYNGGNRQIVAVHKGAYSSIENRGVKIRSSVFDNIVAVKNAWPSAYD